MQRFLHGRGLDFEICRFILALGINAVSRDNCVLRKSVFFVDCERCSSYLYYYRRVAHFPFFLYDLSKWVFYGCFKLAKLLQVRGYSNLAACVPPRLSIPAGSG